MSPKPLNPINIFLRFCSSETICLVASDASFNVLTDTFVLFVTASFNEGVVLFKIAFDFLTIDSYNEFTAFASLHFANASTTDFLVALLLIS